MSLAEHYIQWCLFVCLFESSCWFVCGGVGLFVCILGDLFVCWVVGSLFEFVCLFVGWLLVCLSLFV